MKIRTAITLAFALIVGVAPLSSREDNGAKDLIKACHTAVQNRGDLGFVCGFMHASILLHPEDKSKRAYWTNTCGPYFQNLADELELRQ